MFRKNNGKDTIEKKLDKDKGFEYVQGIFAAFVKNYLEVGKHRDILLASRGIGIGHVDGDLEILYINRDTVL